jgi:hypothetical protein
MDERVIAEIQLVYDADSPEERTSECEKPLPRELDVTITVYFPVANLYRHGLSFALLPT